MRSSLREGQEKPLFRFGFPGAGAESESTLLTVALENTNSHFDRLHEEKVGNFHDFLKKTGKRAIVLSYLSHD